MHQCARQSFVTLSTAESELVAGLDAVVALQSAEAMLQDFGVIGLDKTLRVDSQSALAIAAGQGSWRTRHLRVRAHYLREQYESGQIIPVYCPGVEQAADLLTKALAASLRPSGACLSAVPPALRKQRHCVMIALLQRALLPSKTFS